MRKQILPLLIALLLLIPVASTQTSKVATPAGDSIALPAPTTSGGPALNDVLAKRRSVRSFTATLLTQRELSQLLWSVQGITDDQGHRTAPSAMAKYFLTVYVASADGLFQYVPAGHKLQKLSAPDVRTKLSQQPAISSAPAVFIITGDYVRASKSLDPKFANRCVDLEAGHATQNLLLQATALNLGGVSAGGIDPDMVAKAASLPASSRPIYLVPIGHRKS